MADEKNDALASQGKSKFEQQAKKNSGLVGEIFGFLGQNKKWWLLPILGVFLLIGVLVMLSTTAAAPFIYTFF
ncbi:MAG: DUF5989 family protein [Minicystis sp.]